MQPPSTGAVIRGVQPLTVALASYGRHLAPRGPIAAMTPALGELRQIEERLAALPGLEETLERFREAGLEDRLRDYST